MNIERRERWLLFAFWLVISAAAFALLRRTLVVPGLYYDEAIFGGMAKDFLTGNIHGPHVPGGASVIHVFGRPFPIFVQAYLGALKAWLLMPGFAIGGFDVASLRLTNMAWASVALLVFMFWVRRLLGFWPAIVSALVLVFDPNFFFLGAFDWGVAVPSFLCRFACFYFAIAWWQKGKMPQAFLAGLFAGLGFFNKIDFLVVLAGVGIAAVICYGRLVKERVRQNPRTLLFAALGVIIGIGPMVGNVPTILSALLSSNSHGPSEYPEKIHATLAMYDGSYFERLMAAGGLFDHMFDATAMTWTPLGILAGIAAVILVVEIFKPAKPRTSPSPAAFLLIAAGLISIGAFLLPGAVRLHHTTLVYPFPHLIIALAVAALWGRFRNRGWMHYGLRSVAICCVAVLLCSNMRTILRTQQLIRETGGRGRWSASFDDYCRQMDKRSDVTIISLDWGFNEQLMYLTAGPKLAEPFWVFQKGAVPPLPKEKEYVFLLHPARYTLFDFGYLNAVQSDPDFEVQPHYDRQHEIAFYEIRLRHRDGGF